VVCADISTAIKKVYVLIWSSGMAGLGNNSSKVSITTATLSFFVIFCLYLLKNKDNTI
jgi:hypothetical protein